MSPETPRRSRARIVSIVGPLLVLVLLASCSSDSSGTLESSACKEVHRSLDLYATATRAQGAARQRDSAAALSDLRNALRPAALAASESSDYQALAATLSESSRVSESLLISALTAQCAAEGS